MPPLLLQPTLGMAAPTTLPARAPGAGTPSALHLCSTHPGPQRRYPAGCPPLRRAVAAGSTSPAGTSSSSVGPRITDKPAVPARLWGRLPGPGGDKAASTPTVVAQAVLNSKPSASNVAPTQQRSGGGGGDVPPEEEDTWGIFDAKRYKYRWDVPWGWGVIAGGMVAWQVTFVLVGFVAVPLAYRLADIDIPSLGPDGRAQFTLIAQVGGEGGGARSQGSLYVCGCACWTEQHRPRMTTGRGRSRVLSADTGRCRWDTHTGGSFLSVSQSLTAAAPAAARPPSGHRPQHSTPAMQPISVRPPPLLPHRAR